MSQEKFRLNFREKIESYSPISDSAWNSLNNLIQFRKLAKDEILLNNGANARYFHYLCSGAMIAYFTDEAGNKYNKNIFMENQFAGSTVSMIKGTPSEFTLQTVEETLLISLEYTKFRELIFSRDDLKLFYIAYLESVWIFEKEKREVSIVMEDALTRYKKLLIQYPDIDNRIPKFHIASHLGITPTQLSRIRKNLKK